MTAPSFSMPAPFSITLAQVDLVGGILGVVLSIVISFVLITLVSSYYRFQHIVEQAEEKDPEEIGTSAMEVLRVQLARYLAGCGRRGTSFSLALIETDATEFKIHMDSEPVMAVRHAARRDDVVCLHEDDKIVLLAESEPEDAENVLGRIIKSVSDRCETVELANIRVGIASYPGHGLSGKQLIDVALAGLRETHADRPVILPEIVGDEEEEEEAQPEEAAGVEEAEAEAEDTASKSWRTRRKESILDPVTGVLKPSVVSIYMKRMLGDIRYKKGAAALFCIGVNNMDYISRFHGDDAADDVMAEVSRILQEHLRATDLIGRHEKYAFIVLAKCTLQEAEDIGKRISTLVQHAEFTTENKKLKTTITIGISAHPEHGRNLHSLYSAGQKVLDYHRTNDIRASAIYDPKIHDKVPSKPMKSIKSVQA